MHNSSVRKARAKAARIDRRPVIVVTALSVLACLLVAQMLFL